MLSGAFARVVARNVGLTAFGPRGAVALVLALSLMVAVAVSAVAAEDSGSEPIDPRAFSLDGFDAAKLPFETEASREQFVTAVQEAQERAERRREWLASVEAQEERESSRSAFVGLSDAAAVALAEQEFSRLLEGLAVPDLDDLADGRSVKRFVGDHAVVLDGDGQRPPVLVESPAPLRVSDGQGGKRPVDLSLTRSGDAFLPAGAATGVRLPARLADGAAVGEIGVRPAGSAAGVQSGGGELVAYPNAQVDTDVLVRPVTRGVEVFWQLRSPEAPEQLTVDLVLPEGATAQLRGGAAGGVAVTRGDELVATVTAPVAVDAQGEDVRVEMAVVGDQLVLAIAHRSAEVAYPILVDPVFEDWFNYGSWYEQDDWALSELHHWTWFSSNDPNGYYHARYDCWEDVSCYRYAPSPPYDYWKADGLHVYLGPFITYPAWSNGWWVYKPPGTTTRVANAQFGIKYLRMRGGNNYPFMFTGVFLPNSGTWASHRTFDSDVSNHWDNHVAYASPGPQWVTFGFATLAEGSVPDHRDGYMGGAIIEMTDPEAPTITDKGVSRIGGGAADAWVQDAEYSVTPTATDPGLGVDHFALSGSGVPDGGQSATHPCFGTKSDPCPSPWTLPGAFSISTSGLAEGVNTVTLRAEDVLGQATTAPIEVKVDRGAPGLVLSGALWDGREVTEGEPVLADGVHQLTIDATDPAEGAAPQGTRSGVVKIEVLVDGDVVATDEGACAAGNCARSFAWDFDTDVYAGRRAIRVVATDGAGNKAAQSFVVNAPPRGDLVLPVEGEATSSRLALQAQAHESGFTGVEFQYRRMPDGVWTTIGGVGTMLTDDRGEVVTDTSHALDQPGNKTKKLIWDAKTALALLTPKPGAIQVRGVFAGNGGYTSKAVNAELDEKGLAAGNAQESIGPGSVDLLTGNFSYTATDAALSGFGQGLTLTRTFNSLDPTVGANGPLGPGWVTSAPVSGISGYSSLWELTEPGVEGWVDIYDAGGMRIRFEKLPDGSYRPELGFEALDLARVDAPEGTPPTYTLTDLDGTVTTFDKLEGATEFVPSKVQEAGAQGVSEFVYRLSDGVQPMAQLKRIIAPAPPGLDCKVDIVQLPRGCKVLEFNYGQIFMASLGSPYRLTSVQHVAWDPVASAMKTETVAQFSYYEYPAATGELGRVKEVWDPRISPALKETYGYDSVGRLVMITSPGEAPWQVAYAPDGESHAGKLVSVSRTAQSSGSESWRMSWAVPLSGDGAPYDASATSLDRWGQTDRPTDATAILPPDQVGDVYDRATVYYLNAEGRVVNTAAPGTRVTTAEYDRYGNVVRELTPANIVRAVSVGAGSETLAALLSTYRTYSADGLKLLEELGPQHEVTLDSGQVVQARAHSVITYDEGSTLPADKPAHLPTTMRVGAQVDPSQPDEDVRVTKTEYDWTLRMPTATITDATTGGLNITDRTVYNSAGLEVESRMPASDGTDAGTRKTVYYTHDGSSPDVDCRNRPEWFNLPCKTLPAAQPGTAGLPDLPVTTYTYDRFGQVATTTEQVGTATRTATTSYDTAGRKQSESLSVAGGQPAPQGLVAAFGFDEGAGSAAADGSGTGNDGTVSGASWAAQGRFGGALDFDGVDDAVVVADDDSLDLSSAMTLSAWVRPEELAADAWQHVIVKRDGGTGAVWGLEAESPWAGPALGVRRAEGWKFAVADASLSVDEWVHVAATWNGSSGRIYFDGTLVESNPIDGTALQSSGDLRIGGADGSFFDGLIDEVRVYDRALSAQEIAADRDLAVSAQLAGLGAPVPTTTYAYSETTGRPTTVTAGDETVTIGYDDVGREVSYTDADGNVSTTSYDNLNRPVSVADGKATQTFAYDAQTGLLASLTDSHAGTFTATYDKDGQIKSKGYPNGLTADFAYDEAGAPASLRYTKTTNCSSDCVWIDETVSESIHGQWRSHDWNLSSQRYSYDAAGRLTEVEDDVQAPAAVAGCTIRSYSFDSNSNRTALATKAPDINGNCDPATTPTQLDYTYDDADRLTAPGLSYDSFGRMTQIAEAHSGGGVLTYRYFANDMVRTISQDGVSKTYALDPVGRHSQTVATGGTNHTETLHYSDGSDSPAWTEITDAAGQPVSWERAVEGIDGDLAALHTSDTSGDETVLQLSNLHGDTIATASLDPAATSLLETFETDEFGNPRQTTGRRYGYLGSKQRRTELPSGVIQMGVRSYIPAIGRFSSVDPVVGGSATAYDYGNADPVNQIDLDGQFACKARVRKKFGIRLKGGYRRTRVRFVFRCRGKDVTAMGNYFGIRRHRDNRRDEQVYGPEDRQCDNDERRKSGVMVCSVLDRWWKCKRGETYIAQMSGKVYYLAHDPSDETSLRTRSEYMARKLRFKCK